MHMLRLKDIREDKNLRQEDMAKFLGMSQTNYSKCEKEKINLDNNILRKLAFFFDTSTDYILGLTNSNRPYPRVKKEVKKTDGKKAEIKKTEVQKT